MSTSPQSNALREQYVSFATRSAQNPNMGIEALREMVDSLQHRQSEPTGVTYQETVTGARPAMWVRPVDAVAGRVILYTHGGGFIAHDMTTSRKLIGHLAKAARAVALVPDYRLSPEHPYPAAIEDAIAAYRYLLDAGYSPERITFAGESAGGNLAAATIVKARELGLPLPATYVGFSPWFDLLGERASFDSGTDVYLVRSVSQFMANMYLGKADAHQPLTNPLFADLTGFPAVFVTAGADESLVDAVKAFASKARDAGVDTTIEVAEGMQHSFQWMAGRAPEADENIARVGTWIVAHLKA